MRGKASKEAIERELNEILYGGPYRGVFFTGKKALVLSFQKKQKRGSEPFVYHF